MFGRFTKWLVAMTLIVSLGGHWIALQTVAWVGMAITYSQHDNISTALSKTFDGKHPCKLCQMVREGKQSEKKSEGQVELQKLDFFTSTSTSFHFFKSGSLVPSVPVNFSLRLEPPPTPPPLLA